ncbi:O-antigen ligase family protein [Tabrizicola sp.]|uniref:O-antigen ligase family protein n=1 Tax=Tabrizicola sp. TaxID=2005166 RepID=UPI003F3F51D5
MPALAAVGLVAFFYGIWIAGVNPAVAILIGLMPLALGLSIKHPALPLSALTIMVAAGLSENLTDRFGLPSVTEPAAAGAALVLGLRYVLLRERPLLSGRAVVAFGSLLLWSALSILHARDWPVAADTSFGLAKDLILVFLLLAFIDSPRMLRVCLTTLILTFAVIAALGLYRYVTGSPNDFFGFVGFRFAEWRFAGPNPDANFFASFLVFLIPVCLGRMLTGGPRSNVLFALVGLVLLTVALFLTGSRGGLLAMVLSLPVFLLFLSNRARLWTIGLAIGCAAVIALLLSDQILARFEVLFDPSLASLTADRAVEGRLASWEVARQLFYDNPLLGVGMGNYNGYFQDTALDLGLVFRGEGRSAHSLYLETLAELGLVGLALLLVVLTLALITPFRAAARLAASGAGAEAMELRGFVIGLLAMLLARIFLHDAHPTLLWLAVAIGLAADRIFQPSLSPRTDR